MGAGLVTDLYELNMAASYLRRGMSGPATFSLFVRALPPDRGFLVAAGLEDCLTTLESFAFEAEDLGWLRDAGFDDATVRAFAGLRFTGDVRAVPEGRVVLADEPLLEVTAPAAEAQLVETVLLNHITYQTAIATKAARCRLAAGGMELVDFAFRRTHGIEAGMVVARLSSIAGFAATSNVEAARRYGLPAAGTMAHSYVEAFPREADAFRAFAEDLPGPVTFLVDTYDTLAGVRTAVRVVKDMTLDRPLAVRLDSGDLVALAREARQILDEAGLRKVRIFVSGGLDEYDLERFVLERAPIDAAGVGTRMGVSADAPSLDSAYKLVAFGGRPVCKLSPGKATLPGAKQVWRHLPIEQDVLALREEAGPDGFEPVLVEVMRNGRRLGGGDTIAAARERCARDVAALPPDARRIRGPSSPRMRVSEGLAALTTQTARSAAGTQDRTR
ncbi:nicotinate phosphoribosyltransferase [Actinopolymorpha cephalotaxi]|uniref:Nicotinate phosphoribosyltransferase n=1 Tax=Actinopolymorpha cephalotaxi TaxID=504797 RepID=A0A1I3C0L3_9ACTN|nr:nicotinate phosphoribosyltransferase [Actinopolymorpha cephalotaxi]NYH84067.1 nicotinate phosphoribosyltransferase [Actinopolymorpha cephalotaxi]SFH68105.1 nicotinate phosphoribosyltransferase [Actinopolymorpha cephalotaxi]